LIYFLFFTMLLARSLCKNIDQRVLNLLSDKVDERHKRTMAIEIRHRPLLGRKKDCFFRFYAWKEARKNPTPSKGSDFLFCWCRLTESNRQPTDYDGIFAVFGYGPKEGFSVLFLPRDVSSSTALCFFAFQQFGDNWREKFLAKISPRNIGATTDVSMRIRIFRS